MATEQDFWLARLEAVNLRIVQLETAILTLTTPGMESYTFDDGQTRQTVTRSNMRGLQEALSALLSQRDVYISRLGVANPVYGRPGF